MSMEAAMRLMLAMASFTRGRRWIRKMLRTPPPVPELSTKYRVGDFNIKEAL